MHPVVKTPFASLQSAVSLELLEEVKPLLDELDSSPLELDEDIDDDMLEDIDDDTDEDDTDDEDIDELLDTDELGELDELDLVTPEELLADETDDEELLDTEELGQHRFNRWNNEAMISHISAGVILDWQLGWHASNNSSSDFTVPA